MQFATAAFAAKQADQANCVRTAQIDTTAAAPLADE
jgi:hypothetical protein